MRNCAFRRILISFFMLFLLVNSCVIKRPSEGSKKAGSHITKTVVAVAETDPVPQHKNIDAADDAAIWINRTNPEQSVVIGADKKGGLATYNLYGKQLNYYADGAVNNTDLRYDFPLGEKKIDIVASSNRTAHSISLHKITEGGVLETVHDRIITSEMKGAVYGLCMYKSPETGKYYVYINSKSGEIEQWELFEKGEKVDAKLVRAFHLETQTEGMVADDEFSTIYIGEEVAGIHKLDAEPDVAPHGKLLVMSSEENNNIRFDIEGLTIYDSGNGKGYFIASSQGNYSYAVFERQNNNKYLGSFRITHGEFDGVEETDGIDVTHVNLGDRFPKGMFVVQDGYNYDGTKLLSQNFKFISWEEIEKLLE